MNQLTSRALATVPLTAETVQSFYDGTRSGTAEQCLKALCESHERLRAELEGSEIMRSDDANEIASVLLLMDNLAQVWGDEGVFRRCRDRLRKLASKPAEAKPEKQPRESACVPNGFGICSTHPVCDYMRATVEEYQNEVKKIKAQWTKEAAAFHRLNETLSSRNERIEKALAYAADCSTLEMAIDTIRGADISPAGIRQLTRDFAEDREQHTITRQQWKQYRGNGLTLYCMGDFFTAYFDDAGGMWAQADDTLPMFHVMVESDPPHRTVIHAAHLAAWAQHCSEICMPLQILTLEDA